jgi:acyl-CoA thioester hydrolase
VSGPARDAFTLAVKVYYEDTDAGGVVYYANYLRFMERARTEWLAHLGLPLPELVRRHGALFVVSKVRIDYHQPARLGDALSVSVEVRERGAACLVLAQQVRRGDALLTDADVTLAWVDTGRLKPRRLPGALADALPAAAIAAPWTSHGRGTDERTTGHRTGDHPQ